MGLGVPEQTHSSVVCGERAVIHWLFVACSILSALAVMMFIMNLLCGIIDKDGIGLESGEIVVLYYLRALSIEHDAMASFGLALIDVCARNARLI